MSGDPRLMGLALLVRKFGTRCGRGGYEVFVSNAEVVGMSPHGELQEQVDPVKGGTFLRYYPNVTIDVPEPEPPQPGAACSLEQADKEPADD